MRLVAPASCDVKVRPVRWSVKPIGSRLVTAFARSIFPSRSRGRGGIVEGDAKRLRIRLEEYFPGSGVDSD